MLLLFDIDRLFFCSGRSSILKSPEREVLVVVLPKRVCGTYLLMAPYTMTSPKPKWGSMLTSRVHATNERISLVITRLARLVITS